jgi:hypothetical protein
MRIKVEKTLPKFMGSGIYTAICMMRRLAPLAGEYAIELAPRVFKADLT